MRRFAPNQLAVFVVLIILLLLGAVYWDMLESSIRKTITPATPTPTPTPVPVRNIDPVGAVQDAALNAVFESDGRHTLTGKFQNPGPGPLSVEIPVGMLFTDTGGTLQVVVTTPAASLAAPGESATVSIRSASIRLTETTGTRPVLPSEARLEPLEDLAKALLEYPDASDETIQTAVLILLHNPPLPVFAKFKLMRREEAENPVPSGFFRADTADIMLALLLLKDLPGAPRPLLLAQSQQLKLEAMIDPKAHDLALRYYDIDKFAEWDFWRNELTNGDPSTRHYGLYGIARFYPDIAFKMLPSWVGESRLDFQYRAHAAYALADIENQEALKKLTELRQAQGADPRMAAVLDRAIEVSQQRASRRANPPTTPETVE